MGIIRPGLPARDDLDPVSLREHFYVARAEADDLRHSVYEAEGLIEALENELRLVTMRPPSSNEWQAASSEVIPAVVRAMTLTRKVLFSHLGPGERREAAMGDLRIAEVSFAFLLGLRSLHGQEQL